jgi:hypothetical protein
MARPQTSLLLEREQELDAIEAALMAAQAGEGRLLFVRAHAGIGKSRLLATAVKDDENSPVATMGIPHLVGGR